MSLPLALWLMAAVAYIAYRVGRVRGRAEYAGHVERELGPLLPLLEELRRDEAEFRRLSAVQLDALKQFQEAARSN